MREADYPGTFIVVEGADGAGTTTQAKRLAEKLDAFLTHEPAANPIGGKVDEMISGGDYSAAAIALAFASDRMVHLEEEVIPRLKEGETVVCDRYYHSSLVYQPLAGVDRQWVEEMNRETIVPDLTIVVDIDADTGMSRIEEREGESGERKVFERLDFQQQVVVRYRQLAEELAEEIRLVDGSLSKDAVFEQVVAEVREAGLLK